TVYPDELAFMRSIVRAGRGDGDVIPEV
ncbi:MAG: hypothetical protein QOF16_1731, partial [Actinomycetota bacterium]|nr:hypothetical protein [Actinomycetota bacterium]